MDHETILRVLERQLVGEATPAEEAELARWVAERPERQRVVDELRAQWGAPAGGHDVEAGWGRVAARIGAKRAPSTPRFAIPTSRPSRVARAMAVAAAIVVAAGAGLLWRASVERPAAAAGAERRYAAGNGQRLDVRLADGTRVVIAPGSELTLAASFGGTARDVALDGEAYFEVAHDPARPFTVRTGAAATRVLGTKFGVRKYPEDAEVRVAVREGRVALDTVVLVRGDVGRRAGDGAVATARGVDVDGFLAWTEGAGTLVADNAPMRELVPQLARWYDLDIRLAADELEARRLTVQFTREPLDEVLQVIGTSLDVRVVRDGRVVTLYPRARR